MAGKEKVTMAGKKKVKKVPAIGIGLGTTCSSVAVWTEDRGVVVIPNEESNLTTPSCVAFTATRLLIGEAAAIQAESNPVNTIFDVKRLIGRRFTDTSVATYMKSWPQLKVISDKNNNNDNDDDDDGKPMIVVTYKGKVKKLYAEEITAMILTNMKDIAEAHLGETVKEAVVSVPANFNDSQRQATKDAAQIAGLNVLRIINEPTAAAIDYGLEQKMKKNVLIFDLGGGTFDVSILVQEKEKEGYYTVKYTMDDMNVRGRDFDERMVDHFVKKFEEENGKGISVDFTALTKLRTACEEAKMTLSFEPEAKIEIDSLFQGIGLSDSMDQAQFVRLNKETFDGLKRYLKDENVVRILRIDEVLLFGGSSRIPKIQQIVKNQFGKRCPSLTVNPDLSCTARGAAVQAAILQKRAILQKGVNRVPDTVPNIVIKDAAPLSIGIENAKGRLEVVIWKNTQIPRRIEWKLPPESDDKIYECYKIGEYTNLLGNMELAGMGDLGIDVNFEIDADGILTVKKADDGTDLRVDKGRLSGNEIKEMMKRVEMYKGDDVVEDIVDDLFKQVKDVGIAKKLSDKGVNVDTFEQILEWLGNDTTAQEVRDNNKTAEDREIEESLNKLFLDIYNQAGEGSSNSKRI